MPQFVANLFGTVFFAAISFILGASITKSFFKEGAFSEEINKDKSSRNALSIFLWIMSASFACGGVALAIKLGWIWS